MRLIAGAMKPACRNARRFFIAPAQSVRRRVGGAAMAAKVRQ